MKRIGNSKEPTIQIMLNMASNLKEKFNCYCVIEARARHFGEHSKNSPEFITYVATLGHSFHETWPELLAKYKELMND